ncbi:PAS domain S-box protein [Roseivirga sp.]|uniref:PAS domain S-box protein n=1 Tax=Roseivirga sp. TaxID=1964215 RepID=UPI003B8AF2C2
MEGSILKKEVESKPIGYARFELTVNDLGEPIDAKILEVNPGFEKYFGMGIKELKHITKFQLFESFYKGQEDHWLKKYYDVAFNGKDFVEIVDFDTYLSFELSVYSPVKGQFVTLFQNVSTRQNNDLLYRDILTNMSESVFITDKGGCFKLVCPSTNDIFGLTPDQVQEIGSINELIGLEKQDLYEYVNNSKEPIVAKDLIHSIKCHNGSVKHLSVDIKRINFSDEDLLFVCRDVTDQMEVTNALMLEKQKLKSIINTIPDLIWIKDTSGKYITCNKAFEKLYDLSEDEIIGKKDDDFVTKDEAESYLKYDLMVMNKTQIIKNEQVLYHKDDNQRIEVETTKTPFYDSGKKLLGVLGIARDITERKRSQKEVELSNKKYEMLVSTTSDAIYILNKDLIIMSANHAASAMTGYSSAELRGMFIGDLDKEIGDAQSDSYFDESVEQGGAYLFERIYTTKDGRKVPVEINANVANKASEDQYFCIVRDISIRKTKENRFHEIIEQAPYGIALVADNGTPYMVNDSLSDMLGYTANELSEMSFVEFTHPEDREQDLNLYKKLVNREIDSYKINKRYITKTGKIKNCRLVVCLIDDPYADNGKRALAMVQDVTKRKRQERELAEKNELLAQAQKIAKIGSWHLSVLDDKLKWTDEVFRIFDTEPQSFEGTLEAFTSFIHPDEKKSVIQYFNECVAERKPYSITHRIVTKSGVIKFVEEKAYFEFDDKNKMIIAHGTVQDVTETLSYQNKMSLQIRKLQMALSSDNLVAFEVDLESGAIDVFRDVEEIDPSVFPLTNLHSLDSFISSIRREQRNSVLRKLDALKTGASDTLISEFQIAQDHGYTWYRAVMSRLDIATESNERLFIIIKNIDQEKNQDDIELVAQEMERLRISRDIHDSIGQMLIGTRLMLKTQIINEEYRLEEIDEMLDEMIKESRLIINNFSIKVNASKNLKETFIDLSDKMSRVYHGNIEIYWQGKEQFIDLKVMTNIFRIYQEAISNAIKYSGAKKIKVKVRNRDLFFMDIIDNGRGFDPLNVEQGFGMQNMKSRSESIAAELNIESAIGEGTAVRFRLKT